MTRKAHPRSRARRSDPRRGGDDRAGAGAADAQLGARLRGLGALPHLRALGRRRVRHAHRRPLHDRGLPRLDDGQGDRHQRGPVARHRRHDLHRPALRRALPRPDRHRRRAVHVPRLRPLERLSQVGSLRRARAGLRGCDRQQGRLAHLLRRAPRHLQQADHGARGHGGSQDPRAGRASLHHVPARCGRQPDRRSPSRRCISR